MVPDLDLCLAAQELKILPTAIPCEGCGSALCRSVYTPVTLKRAWNAANHTQLFVQPNWEACGIHPEHVWLSLVIIHTPRMDFPEQKPVCSAFLCGSWSSREIRASSREGQQRGAILAVTWAVLPPTRTFTGLSAVPCFIPLCHR